MKQIHLLKHAAGNQKIGMTLGELVVFMQDATSATYALHGVPKIRSTWRGTIKSIEITIELEDEN